MTKDITMYKNSGNVGFSIDEHDHVDDKPVGAVLWLSYDEEWASDLARAYEISINKWNAIMQVLVDQPTHFVRDGGLSTCGLCHMFIDRECNGCPVKARTGHKACKGSPYDEWYDDRTYENAKKERDFLIQLAQEAGFTVTFEEDHVEEAS